MNEGIVVDYIYPQFCDPILQFENPRAHHANKQRVMIER